MSKYLNELLFQLKNYGQTIPKLSKAIVRPLIQLAGCSTDNRVYNDDVLSLIETRVGPCEELPVFYTIVFIVMQSFFRIPQGLVKAHDLKQCLEELGFKNEVIEDINSALFGPHATQLLQHFSKSLNPVKQVTSILWKIDISLMHSAILHLALPSVILKLSFSNGKTKTFEVTPKLFHKLRHGVAILLRDMHALENRNILRHL